MSTSPLRDASIDFSVKIIKLCGSVRGHGALTNQLERSATSIGANLHEAQYAHGMADFTAKLRIALKECYETEYWLELFIKSEICPRRSCAACTANAAKSAGCLSPPSIPPAVRDDTASRAAGRFLLSARTLLQAPKRFAQLRSGIFVHVYAFGDLQCNKFVYFILFFTHYSCKYRLHRLL